MSRPAPLDHGDQRHLPWGSIRWSVARQMRLAAEMAAQAGDPAAGQYAAVLAGHDVPLTREQVAGFVPSSRQPANLAEHEVWVLDGNDTLRPARQERGLA